MKQAISFLILLVISSASFAQVSIDEKNRIQNFPPGYCFWCCLETLGRHHKIDKLYNLAENRSKEPQKVRVEHEKGTFVEEDRNEGGEWAVYRKLQSLGIKFKQMDPGTQDFALIKSCIEKKLGCVFAVKGGWNGPKSGPHAMVLIDFNDKTVEYIDPNKTDVTYVADREWFDQWWTGYVVVMEKP